MWEYNYSNELYHYGVKGMKWGHRKARYVTGYQAKRNATRAADEARRKSIAESRASGDTGIGSFRRANRKALNAKRKAYGESMKADMDYNKQLRAEKKALKNTNPNRNREIAIAVGSAAGTALAAYGVYKVTQAVKDSNYKRAMKGGMDYLKFMESKGRFDVGFEELQATMSDWHGASTSKVIKRFIDGSTRADGSVDWKGVVNTYKKGASIKL